MFFTAKMRFLQLVVLERDFQKAIDLLADFGWLEIKNDKEEQKEQREHFIDINALLDKIEEKISSILNFFDLEKIEEKGELLDVSKVDEYFSDLYELILPKKEELNSLYEKRKEFEYGLRELEQFKDLTITKKELDEHNFFYFTIGSLVEKDFEQLCENMSGRMIYLELNKDLYILFTSKKGKWTLESELKKLHFKEKEFPFENDVLPSELFVTISNKISELDKQIEKINSLKNQILKKEKNRLLGMVKSFNLQRVYHNIYQTVDHSESTTVIEGWILKKDLPELREKFHSTLGNRVSIVSYLPEELDAVKEGKLKVPVFMNNFSLLKPFEEIIFNYGAPVYSSMDPTIFVAISFLILFGFMFGDIGQGFVLFLIGTIIRTGKNGPFPQYKKISPLFQYVGISAMIFGYLFGSIFCFEHEHVEHILSPINKFLFGLDQPYIINTSLDKVIDIVLLAIGLGIVINLLGILINIINSFSQKKYDEAFLSRNGVAGFGMLLSIFILFLQAALFHTNLSFFLLFVIVGAVILIILKEPLYNIITGKRPVLHDAFGIWILHSIVEFLEIVLITMSNNLSFIRVGAFAVTHALLSFIFLQIASVLGPFGFIIIVLGNLIIIVLEGLIVAIQTLRLEYYEFFSKFFMKKGQKFVPFKIEKTKTEESV